MTQQVLSNARPILGVLGCLWQWTNCGHSQYRWIWGFPLLVPPTACAPSAAIFSSLAGGILRTDKMTFTALIQVRNKWTGSVWFFLFIWKTRMVRLNIIASMYHYQFDLFLFFFSLFLWEISVFGSDFKQDHSGLVAKAMKELAVWKHFSPNTATDRTRRDLDNKTWAIFLNPFRT